MDFLKNSMISGKVASGWPSSDFSWSPTDGSFILLKKNSISDRLSGHSEEYKDE